MGQQSVFSGALGEVPFPCLSGFQRPPICFGSLPSSYIFNPRSITSSNPLLNPSASVVKLPLSGLDALCAPLLWIVVVTATTWVIRGTLLPSKPLAWSHLQPFLLQRQRSQNLSIRTWTSWEAIIQPATQNIVSFLQSSCQQYFHLVLYPFKNTSLLSSLYLSLKEGEEEKEAEIVCKVQISPDKLFLL